MDWSETNQLPKPFSPGQPLADWPPKLATLDPNPATSLLETAIQLDTAITNYQEGDETEAITKLLSQFSEYAHAAWSSIYEDDSEAQFDASLKWVAAIKERLAEQNVPIRIRSIHPGQKFDMDTMLSVESHSGHRLTVKNPLSWILFDNSSESSALASRGKVETA